MASEIITVTKQTNPFLMAQSNIAFKISLQEINQFYPSSGRNLEYPLKNSWAYFGDNTMSVINLRNKTLIHDSCYKQ